MISVIVPIYNVEKYLCRCIESIINQIYKNLQIILVDDGSPDKCGEICDEYAKKDSRITVIHQKNKGVSAARNVGLEIANGEYVGFVDPDDYIDEQMYGNMLDALCETNSDFAICGYDYVDEQGNVFRPYEEKDVRVLTQKEYMSMQFDMPPTVRHGVVNKLFKKELLSKKCFPENLHSSEDVYVVSEYIKRIKRAVFVHKPLYLNTVREGSATHGGLNIESLSDSFLAHDKMCRDAIAAYPELHNHALAFTLDICTLKYNEAKEKCKRLDKYERKQVHQKLISMRKYIKRLALKAVFNKEIYWKTRIMYLIFR